MNGIVGNVGIHLVIQVKRIPAHISLIVAHMIVIRMKVPVVQGGVQGGEINAMVSL